MTEDDDGLSRSLADLLSYQVRRASSSLQSALEAELEPLGLRTSEVSVLIRLSESPGRTQTEVGRDLRVKTANMVPLVSRLVSIGLLERSPGKGRSVALHLTAAGAQMQDTVRAVLDRQEEKLTAGIPAQDKAVALEVVRLIATRICQGLV